jgi:hypothetical protein
MVAGVPAGTAAMEVPATAALLARTDRLAVTEVPEVQEEAGAQRR